MEEKNMETENTKKRGDSNYKKGDNAANDMAALYMAVLPMEGYQDIDKHLQCNYDCESLCRGCILRL